MTLELFHHKVSPPCQAVRMVLESLNIEYKSVPVDLLAGEQTKEEYGTINPHKQVPAIRDGDFILSQSRAIAVYLCNKYEPKDKKEKLFPNADAQEIARFNSIMLRDIDNYHTIDCFLNAHNVFTQNGSGPIQELLPRALIVLQEIDDMVANSKYIFGDYVTILDFFVLETVLLTQFGVEEIWKKYENLSKWRNAMAKLPGSRKMHWRTCST